MRKYISILASTILSFSVSTGAEIYVYTTTLDGSITIAEEAKDFLVNNNSDYNLDFKVPSPLGNFTGARITYKPDITFLDRKDFFVFSLKNANFSPTLTKCWLVFYEYKGIDSDNDGIGDTSFDLNNDYDTNDSFIIAESLKIDKNEILFDVLDYKGFQMDTLPYNSLLYLSCAENNEPALVDEDRSFSAFPAVHDDSYNIVINLKKVDSIILRDKDASSVCIGVPSAYTCCPMSEISQLEAKEKCFINFKNQFSLDMDPRISIIDSYPELDNATCSSSKSGIEKCYLKSSEPLAKFVDDNTNILDSNSCTDTFASSGVIYLKNNADNDIEDPVHLLPSEWKGYLKILFYDISGKYNCDNSSQGYIALDFNEDRMFIDNNGSPNSNTPGDPINKRGNNDIPLLPGQKCSATVEVYELGTPSSNVLIAPQILGWSDDVYIGVTGNDHLKMVKWGLSMEFSIYDKNGDLAYTYTINESSDSILTKVDTCCYDRDTGGYFLFWKPNGDEAYVPYMLNNNEFRVIVSNNSCWDAEIYARVWDSAGRVADNVYLGKVKANSVAILSGDIIFTKARQENPEIGVNVSPLYSMILTVGAPKRDVEFAAYDNRANRTKMIPIYDLSGSEWTYRNVEFNIDPFEQ